MDDALRPRVLIGWPLVRSSEIQGTSPKSLLKALVLISRYILVHFSHHCDQVQSMQSPSSLRAVLSWPEPVPVNAETAVVHRDSAFTQEAPTRQVTLEQ